MMSADQLLSSYRYDLPRELIAQEPVVPRDSSRLMVIGAPDQCTHSIFRELPNWLQPGDLLVLNDTRVLPARLFGRKVTGAPVETLLLHQREDGCWLALVKPGKRFKIGSEIIFSRDPQATTPADPQLHATVVDRDEATGGRWLQFQDPSDASFHAILDRIGHIPFPPYVTDSQAEPAQYQTVYAEREGSAAAPTAGLHFTEELLQTLTDQGIGTASLTLHIGVGTFRPVETEDITQHVMHSERFEIGAETVEKIRQTRAAGGRIFAVGTTVVRALEGAATAMGDRQNGSAAARVLAQPYSGATDLFIYPGYNWQVIDGLITNFHLPGSSLLMLVSALVGRDRLLALYNEAVAEQYRFYSFGDAMLILPEALPAGARVADMGTSTADAN